MDWIDTLQPGDPVTIWYREWTPDIHFSLMREHGTLIRRTPKNRLIVAGEEIERLYQFLPNGQTYNYPRWYLGCPLTQAQQAKRDHAILEEKIQREIQRLATSKFRYTTEECRILERAFSEIQSLS